ncbi:MAG: hypothetical protein KAW92_00385, partial [Candidatus Cloacimonetes bacterium]|nr:hypothetical protein [Candidatus Cloacimonadota bacterium]
PARAPNAKLSMQLYVLFAAAYTAQIGKRDSREKQGLAAYSAEVASATKDESGLRNVNFLELLSFNEGVNKGEFILRSLSEGGSFS